MRESCLPNPAEIPTVRRCRCPFGPFPGSGNLNKWGVAGVAPNSEPRNPSYSPTRLVGHRATAPLSLRSNTCPRRLGASDVSSAFLSCFFSLQTQTPAYARKYQSVVSKGLQGTPDPGILGHLAQHCTGLDPHPHPECISSQRPPQHTSKQTCAPPSNVTFRSLCRPCQRRPCG